jgi:rubrerythrin
MSYMSIEFSKSITKDNLMRAFAGESQARNRYTISASIAKNQGFQAVQEVFLYTANQEKEHAEIFYKHLKELTGENIEVDGKYPVDLYDKVPDLLKAAKHNEYEEADDVYPEFGRIAKEEGFDKIAFSFDNIAKIEKLHGNRFGHFADMIEQNKYFISDVETGWICLNCGHIFKGTNVPLTCPVCDHDRGYFIKIELSPYLSSSIQSF